jgi:hypothetical protein
MTTTLCILDPAGLEEIQTYGQIKNTNFSCVRVGMAQSAFLRKIAELM